MRPANHLRGTATLDADLEVLPGLLTSVLDAVRAAAPDAVIVFVTYPREVPEGNCPASSLADAGDQLFIGALDWASASNRPLSTWSPRPMSCSSASM